eukprot:991280_1
MGAFCSACADVVPSRPVVINMDTTMDGDDGVYGSSFSQNIPDFDSRRTRFDSSKRSDTIFKVKPKTNKTTDTSNTKIKYATDSQSKSDSDSDSDVSDRMNPTELRATNDEPTPNTYIPEKRSSNETTVTINTVRTTNTINTISTMHSLQSNYSTPATIISIESINTSTPFKFCTSEPPPGHTKITYSQSEMVHSINKKHAIINPMSADSAMIYDEDEEDEDSGDEYSSSTSNEAQDYYDNTNLAPHKWHIPPPSRGIPGPVDLSLSHSMPDQCASRSKVLSEYSISIHKRGVVRHAKLSTPPTHYQANRTKPYHTHHTNSNSNNEYEFTPYQPKEVDAIFIQLTSIKKLDTPAQINVILDDFLTDYPHNGEPMPYKYLFRNDIINNLIFAWNLGVKKINSTLITYSIQSLCRFTHRDEFRAPFLAEHGIRLIDKTLSIPSLQSSNSSKIKSPRLASIESAESVDLSFASNSPFGHILAVLKITRDICRLDVIDTMLWCSSKVHQKVLSTMKRDYDEEKITKACRNTLVALLDASYEMCEEIIGDSQIHSMIDSFLESTTTEYLKYSHTSLPHIAEKASGRSTESASLLSRPLFSYNDMEASESRTGDPVLLNAASGDRQIKHGKRKNLLQLEEEAKDILIPQTLQKEDASVRIQPHNRMSMLTDLTERSDDTDEDSDEEDDQTESESEEEDITDESHHDDDPTPLPKQSTVQLNMDTSSTTSRDKSLKSESMLRLPSTKSVLSDIDDAASIRTHICYERQSEVDSILSLKDYDQMVEDARHTMSDIEEAEDDTHFELFSDYHEEEKCHTTGQTLSSDAIEVAMQVHSVNMEEDAVEMEIELKHHQLVYINSLFCILYKIITVKQKVKEAQTLSRPTSVKGPHKSFMELLQTRRDKDRSISGGTAGGLSQMDAVYMSDSEALYHRKKEKPKLKQINHEKNKLLESFFASLSFKNLFKLLKYYRLSCHLDVDDESEDSDHGSPRIAVLAPFLTVTPFSAVAVEADDEDNNNKMISIEKLACKILRKILSYSQIITDKLLIDDELDVIGILVTLLFRNPSNIDLIIYILDIFSKISKDNDDIRDLLLDPRNFDKFLRALDPWWMIVIESTAKLTTDTTSAEPERVALAVEDKQTKKPQTFLHLQLMEPVTKVLSVDSIGIADNHPMEDALHIEVTIAMLKFFKDLSESNALDMVDYGINDRILVLLDYYLNISIKYDPYDDESLSKEHNFDLNMDYSFVFGHEKHQQCMSLCLECIQNLATDINMLLEFVYNGTVEKLSRICWSFRNHSVMIKKCCDVIHKLLKLEQSYKQIARQNVLPPLIWAFQFIFKKAFVRNQIYPPKLLIAAALFPNSYGKSNRLDEDDEPHTEEEEEEEDSEEYEDEDTTSEDEIEPTTNDTEQQAIVLMNSPGTQRTHKHLQDLKEICNVLMNVSYVDNLCVEIVESKLMLLLIECIANKGLMIHHHMMISLIVSDLLQHLSKNKKGADALIDSERFEIAKYIVNAIENNQNNRGVVLKYLRALINLKDANQERLKQQLIENHCVGFLKQIGVQFHQMINIDQILQSDNEDNDDKVEMEDDEKENGTQ